MAGALWESHMSDTGNGEETELQKEYKERLVKAARMHAMCRKAEYANPLEIAGLAVAAFEDMPLREALVFLRSNEQTIDDLAWAFENSDSTEEFEQRLKEIRGSS